MNSIIAQINQGIDAMQSCSCTTLAMAAIALVGLVVVAKCVLGFIFSVLGALTTGSKLKKYYKPGSWAGTSCSDTTLTALLPSHLPPSTLLIFGLTLAPALL